MYVKLRMTVLRKVHFLECVYVNEKAHSATNSIASHIHPLIMSNLPFTALHKPPAWKPKRVLAFQR